MKHFLSSLVKRHLDIGPSRKFFLWSLAFIFGVGVHATSKLQSWETAFWIVAISIVLLCIFFVIFLLFAITRKVAVAMLYVIGFFSLLLIFFGVGLLLYEKSLGVSGNDVSSLNGQKVALRGVVSKDPDIRLDHQKIVVSGLRTRGTVRSYDGKLLVRLALYPEVAYGDEVELRCALQKPEPVQDFAYDEYLARWNIYSVCYRPEYFVVAGHGKGNWLMAGAVTIKKYLSRNISAGLPEPYASLARGIALGERGTIPLEIQENFRRVGISHLLAISGFNITIVIYFVGLFIKRITYNKKLRFILISIGILFFVLLVGVDASVVRAAIMGSLALLARSGGRIPPPRITLSLAGAVMLGINPKLIAFDRGFLLSFAATIGIIYFAPLLQKYTESHIALAPNTGTSQKKRQHKGEIRKFLEELLYSTIAAIIFTTPLVFYFFKNISLVALPVNVLVVPISSLVMILSLMVGMLGFFLPFTVVFSPILYASMYYVMMIADIFARFHFGAIIVSEVHWIIVPILYGIISYAMWFMNKTHIKSYEKLST